LRGTIVLCLTMLALLATAPAHAQSGYQVIQGTRVFTVIDPARGVATFSNSCGSQTLTQAQLQAGAIPDGIIPCPRFPSARQAPYRPSQSLPNAPRRTGPPGIASPPTLYSQGRANTCLGGWKLCAGHCIPASSSCCANGHGAVCGDGGTCCLNPGNANSRNGYFCCQGQCVYAEGQTSGVCLAN
jgi:hypothetical protein